MVMKCRKELRLAQLRRITHRVAWILGNRRLLGFQSKHSAYVGFDDLSFVVMRLRIMAFEAYIVLTALPESWQT